MALHAERTQQVARERRLAGAERTMQLDRRIAQGRVATERCAASAHAASSAQCWWRVSRIDK
jgi:hypothetical protein